MITEDVIRSAKSELENNGKNTDFFSKTRDVFSARLDTYVLANKKYLEAAIIGEIGNNSFDHNFNTSISITRGAYFNPYYLSTYCLLADFGQGLLSSLKVVKPNLATDLDAVKTAFSEHISGRAPEQRGNGLKFVLKSIQENAWSLYYQSGNGICLIDKDKIEYQTSPIVYNGCMAILKF